MDINYESKINDICEMQKLVISCLKSDLSNGGINLEVNEAGAIADIIKDLSEAEKNCREASYYKAVTEAMDEKSYDRYGYSMPRVSGNIRYGYKPMVDQEPYIDGYLHDPDFKNKMNHSEYGMPYNEYMSARRHYTQTKSSNDKSEMDRHAREHLDQTIETIEDIWDDASPELKMKMKSDISKLMDSMM